MGPAAKNDGQHGKAGIEPPRNGKIIPVPGTRRRGRTSDRVKAQVKETETMEFTNRMVQDPEDSVYRWYYDVGFGQEKSELVLSLLTGIMLIVLAVFVAVFVPAEKENKPLLVWGLSIAGVISSAGSLTITWLKYRQRGGYSRIRYILEPGKLMRLNDNRTTAGLKTVGRMLQVSDALSGVPINTADRAELTGEQVYYETPLDKVTGVTFDIERERIILRCGSRHTTVYIGTADFDVLKEYILAHIGKSVRTRERTR